MPKYARSVTISLWADRIILGLLAALAIFMPKAVGWYGGLRLLPQRSETWILVAFYLSFLPTAYALLSIDRLLLRIRVGQVFLQTNVQLIRRLIWCCAVVSLITLLAGTQYPPLLFITVIMAFLCLIVSVIANVMETATILREEHDLTI